jgi:hypothetical protein
MGNYIGNEKNAFCVGQSKQPPAQMALCWRAGYPPAQRAISTSLKLLTGAVPASKKRF